MSRLIPWDEFFTDEPPAPAPMSVAQAPSALTIVTSNSTNTVPPTTYQALTQPVKRKALLEALEERVVRPEYGLVGDVLKMLEEFETTGDVPAGQES